MMSGDFYKMAEKVLITLMIGAVSAVGIGVGVRAGSDPLREEFAKFREVATKLLEDHEQRISNIERLTGLGR